MTAFGVDQITDQKRLVRGEQYLAARTYLRSRDFRHNVAWRVLILAGGAPAGEVDAIRELMPKAHIVAVDRDPACLEAACMAGVDEVIECDLSELSETTTYGMNPALVDQGKFDILSLDLCALATPQTRRLFNVYRAGLTRASGVMIATFSYGRDVSEAYAEALKNSPVTGALLTEAGMADQIAGRLVYLFGARNDWPGQIERLRSVMAYRGAQMPMISALFHKGATLSFVQVGPGDFELAVTCPDPAKLYACPQERIEALRRSHAAIRAAHTRQSRNCA